MSIIEEFAGISEDRFVDTGFTQFNHAVKQFGQLILWKLNDLNCNCWIAGGAVRDFFIGKPITTDYDIFFESLKDWEIARDYFIKEKATMKWDSENGMKVYHNGKTFDLVKKFFETPEKTIENFDFTVSMFAVSIDNVYHGQTSFIDLAKKQLIFNDISMPVSTLSRSFRYYQKGYKMCIGEMLKLTTALQDSKPEDTIVEKTNGKKATSFIVGMD